MKIHENILVFYSKPPSYNPQMVRRTPEEYKSCFRANDSKSKAGDAYVMNDVILKRKSAEEQWYKYPTTELKISVEDKRDGVECVDEPIDWVYAARWVDSGNVITSSGQW